MIMATIIHMNIMATIAGTNAPTAIMDITTIMAITISTPIAPKTVACC